MYRKILVIMVSICFCLFLGCTHYAHTTQDAHQAWPIPVVTTTLENADIREMAAQSLSKMECPDFSGIPNAARAFLEVWRGFRADQNWLTSFKQRISELSNGQVQLLDSKGSGTRGPVEYLVLVGPSFNQKVTMGPYSNPIQFED